MSAPASAPTPVAAALPAPASASQRQWDRCLENGALKTTYGAALGAIASVVLFRSAGTRLAATGFAAGMGAGMAWYECKQAYAPSRFQNSLLSAQQNAAAASSTLCRCGRPECRCGANCKMVPVGFSTVQGGVLPTFDVKK